VIDSNSDDEPEEFAPKVDMLCRLAAQWIDEASPAELWDVLEHGGLDERVGMAGTLSNLGTLPGPAATFLEQLAMKTWAPPADRASELLAWFEANPEAQRAARHELQREVAEVRFALGAIQWMSTEGA
jgi:hypothetical protein